MKRKMAAILAAVYMLCGGCSILPGEDRAFPVCLGLHMSGGQWQVSARISTYTNPGEYMTLTAGGESLAEAMTLLDASAPMRLHYGQVRLVIFSRELAESDELIQTLDSLNRLGEFRADALLCVTEAELPNLMEEMKPATGTRLSKSIEVLTGARIAQGTIPETTIGAYRRQGERQSLTMIAVALPENNADAAGMEILPQDMEKSGMNVQLAGAWLVSQSGKVTGQLNAYEHQLLRLMQNGLRKGALTTGDYSLTLLESFADAKLKENAVRLTIRLRYRHSNLSEDGVQQQLTKDIAGVIGKLAAANCDALGLGRQAMLHASDWTAWRDMNWQQLYPALIWEIVIENS